MIAITFHKTKAGEYIDFICSGHAGFDDHGKDIVCASVSVLVINTINSLEELTETKMIVESDEKKGLIACKFTEPLTENARVLVDSLLLGLTHIAEQYGKKYCKPELKQV